MNIPAEFMALTSEAVVIVRGSAICYSNRAADELIGFPCLNRNIRDVLGAELAAVQASSYCASILLNNHSVILRSSVIDGLKLFIFSSAENSGTALNSAFLSTINSTLMGLSLDIANGSAIAEALENAELSECISSTNKNYYRLKRLSSNASTAENFFSHTLPFYPMPYDLCKLVRSYISAAASMCPQIHFSLNMPESLILTFDRQLVFSAVSNLISNCLTHSNDCSLVSVTVTDSNSSVLVSVSDNGSGIAPDVLSDIFNHYRNVNTLNSCYGAGFGMTVVRAATETHGGTLLIESRTGVGTTVKFSLSKDISQCSDRFGIGVMREDVDMSEVYTSLPDKLPSVHFI